MLEPDQPTDQRAFAQACAVMVWLGVCCLLVFATVILGGAVRLTGSGLSMVDWQPILGVIPPLNQAQWQQAFEKYQQFPEFQLVNADISLARFQFLFWMEYAHRFLGRVIGFVFLLPFLFFLWRGWLAAAVARRLWLLFLLGGLQGLLGWYLVKSGLVEVPQVSHYRLAMHLLLAVVIYAWMLRLLVGLYRPHARHPRVRVRVRILGSRGIASIALGVTLLMIASGALVAGSHAGYAYNTWPKMGGDWFPQLVLTPWWLNFFENIAAIQFIHRWLAMVVLLAVCALALRLRDDARAAGGAGISLAYALAGVVVAQVLLGIATLLLRVPVALGVAHQAGAMVLLSVVVIALAMQLPSFAPAHSAATEER